MVSFDVVTYRIPKSLELIHVSDVQNAVEGISNQYLSHPGTNKPYQVHATWLRVDYLELVLLLFR
jgi:hypothetical protein